MTTIRYPNFFSTYLEQRGLPCTAQWVDQAGIRFMGPQHLEEVLGFMPRERGIGMVFAASEDYHYVVMDGGGKLCPKGKEPVWYKPPLIDWDTVEGTLHIVESTTKALAFAHLGYAAVAANGVAAKVAWGGFPNWLLDSGQVQEIKICFDSNTEGDNANVKAAVAKLMAELKMLWPQARVVKHVLPKPEQGGDWGPDDALATLGEEWLRGWLADDQWDVEKVLTERLQHYHELNELYCVNMYSGKIIRLLDGQEHSHTNLIRTLEADRTMYNPERERMEPVASDWLAWEDRLTVEGQRYLPGCGMLEGEYYNSWRDTGCAAVQGDVSLFLDLVEDAIQEPEVREYLLNSMAFAVQQRNVRHRACIYIAGADQGTGKSTMLTILAKCLGQENTARITVKDLKSDFNGYLLKEAYFLDDGGAIPKDLAAELKANVSNDVAHINQKFVGQYNSHIWGTFWVTANDSAVIPMDGDDRRTALIGWSPTRTRDWEQMYDWLGNGGGYEAIKWWLMERDLGGFDENARPPMTAAKANAIAARASLEEEFMMDFAASPGSYGVKDVRWAITSHELYQLCYGQPPIERGDLQSFTKTLSSSMRFKRAWDQQVSVPYEGRKSRQKVTALFIPGRERAVSRVREVVDNLLEQDAP